MSLYFQSICSSSSGNCLALWSSKTRILIDCGLFSIRLHHWLYSDDTRYPHDHGWDFVSIVLWGSLIDRNESGDEHRRWLSVKKFKAEHRHMVVIDRPAWTLLFCRRERRVWGFWVNDKFRKRNKYFFEYGHHNPRSATNAID